MPTHEPVISAAETARRGDELYQRLIRSAVERDHYGKVVAIDVKTGEFAVADNAWVAARRLRERRPEAEVWFVRVGQPTLHRIGARPALGRA